MYSHYLCYLHCIVVSWSLDIQKLNKLGPLKNSVAGSVGRKTEIIPVFAMSSSYGLAAETLVDAGKPDRPCELYW
jgi:hypothetical protein